MSVKPKRVVLVTGARKGIGEYLASHFLKKGDAVIGCSRQSAKRNGSGYRHFTLDVADETAVREMVHSIGKEFGRLDILINSAGIAAMNHMLLTPTDTARKVLETNVLGTFIVCREAVRLMRKHRQGRIVNIGSVAVPMKIEGEAVYAASKSAVVVLTEIAARELAPFQITCNVVALPPVPTDLIRGVPEEKIRQIVDRLAIKRFCRFEDIANAVDFFVNPASDFVTGQVLTLGGA